MEGKLVVAMVGLPARGKSTMARKLEKAFTMDGVKVKIFNNGKLRRKLTGPETSLPDFFSPSNPQGVALRERFAMMNLEMARGFLQRKGQVAIIDAANVTCRRREAIERFFPRPQCFFSSA
jgi:predicted kinase